MSANFEAKKVLVEQIKEKISKAKSLTFVDYRGITVDVDTEMRSAFRKAGAEYRVYKNRLMLRALNELGITGADKLLEGTTAVAFSYNDEVSAAKIASDLIEKNQKIQIKFGVLSGKLIDAGEVDKLAKLPSKEVLVAKLLGVLSAPATNLVYVLSAPTRGLACALKAIAEK